MFGPYQLKPLAFYEWSLEVYEAGNNLSAQLSSALGLPVEHIGSTAVPGLGGKNSINLRIVAGKAQYAEVLAALDSLGLVEHPHINEPETRPLRVGSHGSHVVHVQVVEEGSPDHLASLFFREYLLRNPSTRQEYETLKRSLVESGLTTQEYGARKQAFIQDVILRRPEGWSGPQDPLP